MFPGPAGNFLSAEKLKKVLCALHAQQHTAYMVNNYLVHIVESKSQISSPGAGGDQKQI